jgi:hypothetical protein
VTSAHQLLGESRFSVFTQWLSRNREAAAVIVLTVIAFAVRVHQIDFYSLSEDESVKMAAIQEYRHGHFAGVNSEHPMLPKMLEWASLTAGARWNTIASIRHWPTLMPEGWLRLPNVILGAATTAILYLLCRRMMGPIGSLAVSVFWAISPLPIALNRLAKEETPLTFFTLVACYFYCRAQQAVGEDDAKRWYDLSGIGFGLALASQYILHLLGLNFLAWFIARKFGLTQNQSRFSYRRFYLAMFITFIVVNPVILSPSNFHAIISWLHHDGVRHSGYDFDGKLYLNFPSRLLAGLPWFYYLCLLVTKTPIPILVAVIAGSIILFVRPRTLASCYFLTLGMIQLAGLSVSGAKWIRYSLPLLPFLYLAGGYALQRMCDLAQGMRLARALIAATVLALLAAPLIELRDWAPYYSFYLNPLAGGKRNIARYFAPDEVSEFDSREVAQSVCRFAHFKETLATARPMSLAYYLQASGRADLKVVPLYDSHYMPLNGDLIVLEPSRRYFETQRFFDSLGDSGMLRTTVHVGPVHASTIYLYDASADGSTGFEERSALVLLYERPQRFRTVAEGASSASASWLRFSDSARRLTR